MDLQTALDTLARRITAGTLTEQDRAEALDGARIPDPAGRLPGFDGYVPTFDLAWATATLADMAAANAAATTAGGDVIQVTSEGTTIQRQPTEAPDWASVAAFWRSRSVIAAALGGTFGVLQVPVGEPYVPRSADTTGDTWQAI